MIQQPESLEQAIYLEIRSCAISLEKIDKLLQLVCKKFIENSQSNPKPSQIVGGFGGGSNEAARK